MRVKVAEKYPNATYVHCRSHVLNLVISSGCKAVRSIQNLFDNVRKLTWFLNVGAKTKEIFLRTAAVSRNGVQAKVAEKYPNATYVYCRSHVLNLAISCGCKAVQSIQNLFDNVSKLTWFF